ncbi:hypothetical protein LI90_4004 [Carbonactinospora thermoautotrophica]|uniref:DUF6980 domain-containing protein n=1 Tax=Carbonactinospora thermoautotrophica TaxID=1469144 RepID=A0A132MYG6_9ACTN|nr:hypothetical protein LI90_4004 [Carbonactinospora thermoautotrophica]
MPPGTFEVETTAEDQCCELMLQNLRADDLPVVYDATIREWGIRYLDGGSSIQRLEYCPWCGKKLPGDLWDEWRTRVEQLGLDPWDDADRIPEAFRSDRWWKEAGL